MPVHDAYARLTPYERLLPGADFPTRRFTAIEAEARRRGVPLDDPAAFVLLDSAAEALGEWVGEGVDTETLSRYAVLLFHAYHHYRAGTPVYLLETPVVRVLLAPGREGMFDPASSSRRSAAVSAGLYLQLPQHLVWARTEGAGPPVSLDGVFRTVTDDGRLHLLPIGGMGGERAGFEVIAVPSAPVADEPEWLATTMRADGGDFLSSMPGAEFEGLYELATAGEALKLVALAVRYLGEHPDRLRAGVAPERNGPVPSALPSTAVSGAPGDRRAPSPKSE